MHPIKRAALVLVLSLGAIGGFTHGFAHMAQCHGGGCAATSRRDQFEEHIADVCTRAAQRVYDEQDRDQPPAYQRGGWGGPQWGGPPPSWGPPPQYWGAPPAPAAAPAAPVAPVAPAAPVTE